MYNSFKIKYETSINKLNKDVEKMKELQNQNKLVLDDLSKTVSSFENIDETIEYVDERIDTFKEIDDKYTEFEERFGSQFDQVNENIKAKDEELQNLNQEMESQFDQVNENIKTNEEELKMLNEETSTIEEKMKKIENDIVKDEEEKQQIEEESPFRKRLYDFQEKYLKGNETMIGVSSAVLALSSYFLVSRGKKKGNETIKLSDSQDKDKSTISGNKAKTSKPVQNIDNQNRIDKKKAAVNLTHFLSRRPPPNAIPNTKKSNQSGKQSGRGEKIKRLIPLLTTALTNKEKVGRLNETNAQTYVGPRVQKQKNPKTSLQDNQNRIDKKKAAVNLTHFLSRRPPPNAIPNTKKSNQSGKQSGRKKSNTPNTQKRIPNALLTALKKDNVGKLNKPQTQKRIPNEASTQKPKAGFLNDLISGRNNLKKPPVQTNPKPAVNTDMEQLALAIKKRRRRIAPSAEQQSSEWSD